MKQSASTFFVCCQCTFFVSVDHIVSRSRARHPGRRHAREQDTSLNPKPKTRHHARRPKKKKLIFQSCSNFKIRFGPAALYLAMRGLISCNTGVGLSEEIEGAPSSSPQSKVACAAVAEDTDATCAPWQKSSKSLDLPYIKLYLPYIKSRWTWALPTDAEGRVILQCAPLTRLPFLVGARGSTHSSTTTLSHLELSLPMTKGASVSVLSSTVLLSPNSSCPHA